MPNNLGFDAELLMLVNSAKGDLVQIGVEEFENVTISAETEWPAFANTTLGGMIPELTALLVRKSFDPIASETIAKGFNSRITVLYGRIAHEIDEVNNV